MNKLKITQYSDPMCIWCYAVEAPLRKINYLIGDKIDFEYKLGLLIADVGMAIGNDEFSDARYGQLRGDLKNHFIYASQKSGIPVSVKHMDIRKKEDITSLPMSVAYMAMKLTDETKADDYMRCLREATHSFDIITSRYENLINLAENFDIDIEEFKRYLNNGQALEKLNEDVRYCREREIQSFPTILFEYGENKKYLYGFADYDVFKSAIEEVTSGEISPADIEFNIENAVDFINYYGKVSAKELQVMFSLNDAEMESTVLELADLNLAEKIECGNSYFISKKSLLSCENGVCSVK